MGNRVSATIAIGGHAPAGDVDRLLEVIESERLGPAFGEVFVSRAEMLAYLQADCYGPILYGVEVNGGEFDGLQAFCAEHGLVYQLVADGYGGDWGPATRIHAADGSEETCSLDADGGFACVTSETITRLGFSTVAEIKAYLERFDGFHAPPLILGSTRTVD